MDASVVGKAFLHHEKREVDKGACISFNGLKYETSAALIGATVEIAYVPMAPEIITVTYPGIEPIEAKLLKIGSFCDPKPELPICMLPSEPEESRFLKGLEHRHAANRQQINMRKTIMFARTEESSRKSGYESEKTIYTCEDCSNCSYAKGKTALRE